MSEFLNMGGYALYVWASYGLTLVVVAVTLFTTLNEERRVHRRLTRQMRRESK